jgi:hypothetical protein
MICIVITDTHDTCNSNKNMLLTNDKKINFEHYLKPRKVAKSKVVLPPFHINLLNFVKICTRPSVNFDKIESIKMEQRE